MKRTFRRVARWMIFTGLLAWGGVFLALVLSRYWLIAHVGPTHQISISRGRIVYSYLHGPTAEVSSVRSNYLAPESGVFVRRIDTAKDRGGFAEAWGICLPWGNRIGPLHEGSAVWYVRGIIPLWLVLVGLGMPSLVSWWYVGRKHAAVAGRCDQCGYDLRSNASGICPECGTAIPADRRAALASISSGGSSTRTDTPGSSP